MVTLAWILIKYGSSPGALIASTIKYLTRVLEEWPVKLRGPKINPHADNLFVIRDEDNKELLPKEIALQFHQTMAQLILLCMRT